MRPDVTEDLKMVRIDGFKWETFVNQLPTSLLTCTKQKIFEKKKRFYNIWVNYGLLALFETTSKEEPI